MKYGSERVFLAAGVLQSLHTERLKAMAGVSVTVQAAARGMASRKKIAAIRTKIAAMEAAGKAEEIEALEAAIEAAKAVCFRPRTTMTSNNLGVQQRGRGGGLCLPASYAQPLADVRIALSPRP